MIKLDTLTPNFRQNALISVNALIDIDIGLFTLIKEQYLDPSIFNVDYFKESSILDYINTTYYRKVDNPLYLISNINDKNLLDEYYVDFFKSAYNDIYDRSTYTDMLSVVEMFIDSKEIDVSILYYKDYSFEELKKDQEKGILPPSLKFIDAKSIKPTQLNEFKEIYVRSVTELDVLPIKKLISPKNFYISSFGPNFSENGQIKRNEGLINIMTSKLMHDISIFDIYNQKNIKNDKEPEGET